MMSKCLICAKFQTDFYSKMSLQTWTGGGGRTPTLLNLCLFNETPNLVRY